LNLVQYQPQAIISALHKMSSRYKLIPGDRPCDECNSLFTNPTSRDIILDSETPFEYRRDQELIFAAAENGCALCIFFKNNLTDSRSHLVSTDEYWSKVDEPLNVILVTGVRNGSLSRLTRGLITTVKFEGKHRTGDYWGTELAPVAEHGK
jgi:hypothetical protein